MYLQVSTSYIATILNSLTPPPPHTPIHAHSFEQGSGPIWIDNIRCSSQPSQNIVECASGPFGVHDCDHSQDVALVCLGGACNPVSLCTFCVFPC